MFAEAGQHEACGGVRHGGADAPARRCPAGYACSRQDSWWWFCKPTPNEAKPVAQQPQQQKQQPANDTRTAACNKPVSVNTSAAGVTYRRYSAMVAGKVLVRDVGSLSDNGATYQYGPETFDETSCENRCRRTRGCNAWRVCPWRMDSHKLYNGNLHPGCGRGCLDYGKTHTIWQGHPKAPMKMCASIAACSSTMINITWPAEFIGPANGFYGTKGCAWTCADGKVCKQVPDQPVCLFPECVNRNAIRRTDRWSLGTCTLLQVDSPADPKFTTGDAGYGWWSGTMELPATCKDLPAAKCDLCQEQKQSAGPAAVQGCLDCLRAKNVSGADELTWQDIIVVKCRKHGSQKFEEAGSTSDPRLSELECAYDAEKWMKSTGYWSPDKAECRAVRMEMQEIPQ